MALIKTENQIQKFAKEINRQRINPKIFDFSYLFLRNNILVFKKFKELVGKGNRPRILDVGCGFKSWAQMFDDREVEYFGVDFDKGISLADIVASADELPFSDDKFDALIYSEVLEHTKNLDGAIKEMRRVAKNNALIFISSPFVFPEHGIPYDFQRLTKYFYHNIFKNDEIVLIEASNSSLSTTFVSFNLFIESTPFRIFWGLKHVIFIFNNIVALIIDKTIGFVFSRIAKRFKKYFYLMPLSYALIVRMKK